MKGDSHEEVDSDAQANSDEEPNSDEELDSCEMVDNDEVSGSRFRWSNNGVSLLTKVILVFGHLWCCRWRTW